MGKIEVIFELMIFYESRFILYKCFGIKSHVLQLIKSSNFNFEFTNVFEEFNQDLKFKCTEMSKFVLL